MTRNTYKFVRSMAVVVLGGAVALASEACWELDSDVYAEGNYDIAYDDMIDVYLNDELVVTLDAAEGGQIPLTEDLFIEYDELCADPDAACPSRDLWDRVAIYQPLGTNNALLNAVNIGSVGEPGQRLAGVVDTNGDFTLLLGLSASANESCLTVGISTAEGHFDYAGRPDNPVYDNIRDGVITLTYASGCEIVEGVILTGTLSFETSFEGIRTGDVDLEGVDADPAIDEDGEELSEDPLVD